MKFIKKNKFLLVGILTTVVLSVYFQYIRASISRIQDEGIMSVVFLKVGQGDSILVTTPNLNQVVIDTSPNETVVRQISKHLNYFDKTIDMVISTHADLDHIGGLPSVIDKYKITSHAYDFSTDESSLTREIDRMSDEKRINKINLQAGDRIILDSQHDIYIDILWPTPEIKLKDKNDNSIVTRIVFNEVSFLLTGDASIEVEEFLIKGFANNITNEDESNDISNSKIKSTVLKLGHHGSKTSTDSEFLEEVEPEFAVVSAGLDNKFGHPHQEVIETIKKYSPEVNILDNLYDSVRFETDGIKINVISAIHKK